MFSLIVFMNRTLRGQWIAVVILSAFNLIIASTSQIPRDNVMRFSGDFEGFLKDLGSMVYTSKKGTISGNDLRSSPERPYTTPPHKNYRRSQNIYNTQKAALGDVLMMKLVSYYEDKYKLTHHEPTTTESITFMDTFTNNVNKYNVDILDRVELSDNRHPTQQERSRRMEGSLRRSYDDTIPEVVIL